MMNADDIAWLLERVRRLELALSRCATSLGWLSGAGESFAALPEELPLAAAKEIEEAREALHEALRTLGAE